MCRFGSISALVLAIAAWGQLASAQEVVNPDPPTATATAPRASDEEGQEDTAGETAGLVVIIVGAVGVITGASLMVAGAVAQDEPEAGLSQADLAAAASGAGQAEGAEETDDTHILTSIGAVTFVGSAVLMAVGGWIRFDWADDEGGVAITPYVTPHGAGVVATF